MQKFTALFRKRTSEPEHGKNDDTTPSGKAFHTSGVTEAPPTNPPPLPKPQDFDGSRPRLTKHSYDNGDTQFGNVGVSRALGRALAQIEYHSPTPIQEAVIPLVRQGKDVVGQAQTGTGKTAAFGIPIIESVNSEPGLVQALVLTPTRELAVQVKAEISKLSKFHRIRSVAIFGGQPIVRQIEALQRGVHIIIATPGRLIDHLERGTISLQHVKLLVLDEADQMLDIGFADEIRRIIRSVPESRQTLLFSATMPNQIRNLARWYMKNPKWIRLGGESEPVDRVEQLYFQVAERDKYLAMEEVLSDNYRVTQALVFRRTRAGVDRLVNHLKRRRYDVEAIHGDLTQPQRDMVMSKFRAGKLRLLVATNLAARGLDIPDVSHVINYDIPDNLEDYVHRIGRTARMGRPGTAITFVAEWDFDALEAIQAHVKDDLKGGHLSLYST